MQAGRFEATPRGPVVLFDWQLMFFASSVSLLPSVAVLRTGGLLPTHPSLLHQPSFLLILCLRSRLVRFCLRTGCSVL